VKKLVIVAIIGIFIGAAAGWALRRPRDPNPGSVVRAQEHDADSASDPPAARSVTLDPDAVRDMGLGITILKPARHAPQFRTTAVVLSPQSLASLSATYITDVKDLAMARANLAVAQGEYRRQSELYRENQNTSLKALQAERGAMDSSQAQTNAAQQQLRIDALNAEQQWGPVIGKWLISRSPRLEKILGQQEWLVEVTFGASDPGPAPRIARLIAPSGLAVLGRYISPFPQTNPVIQGLNFLYVIPARPGFAPGLNLEAEIPAGPERSGVVIPASAVIWSQGEAWAYKEIATGRFQRLAVKINEPVANGWFVTTTFFPGDRVVTRAAEELFSAEAQPASGSQGGGDAD
jgi:hypothetical protein